MALITSGLRFNQAALGLPPPPPPLWQQPAHGRPKGELFSSRWVLFGFFFLVLLAIVFLSIISFTSRAPFLERPARPSPAAAGGAVLTAANRTSSARVEQPCSNSIALTAPRLESQAFGPAALSSRLCSTARRQRPLRGRGPSWRSPARHQRWAAAAPQGKAGFLEGRLKSE